eukprot:3939281-Rhodomonas_salina.1
MAPPTSSSAISPRPSSLRPAPLLLPGPLSPSLFTLSLPRSVSLALLCSLFLFLSLSLPFSPVRCVGSNACVLAGQ